LNEWMKKENVPMIGLGYSHGEASNDADEEGKRPD
jgi:hypothetical protein